MAIILRAKNFQSWEDVSLEINGLTVIVGPGNLGKSALFRALKGLVRNELNANQVRLGGDVMEVQAVINGLTISAKRKRKGSTTYEVGGVDYAKLGGNVPDTLKDLKFEEILIGDGKLDPIFASQFGGQFLIEETPAALNAILGAFSCTEKLEAGKREGNIRIAEKNAQAKALAIEAREVEERLARLEVLSDRAAGIQAVMDEVEPVVRVQEKTVEAIAVLIEQLKRVEKIGTALRQVRVPDVERVAAGMSLLTAYKVAAVNLERCNRTKSTLTRLVVPDPTASALQIQQATAFASAGKALARKQGLQDVLRRFTVPDTGTVESQLLLSRNAAACAAATENVLRVNRASAAIEVVITNWKRLVKIHKLGKSYSEAGDAIALAAASPAKARLSEVTIQTERITNLVSAIEQKKSTLKALEALTVATKEQAGRVLTLVDADKAYGEAQERVAEIEKAWLYETGLKVCPNCWESIQIGDIHNGNGTNSSATGHSGRTQSRSEQCQVVSN